MISVKKQNSMLLKWATKKTTSPLIQNACKSLFCQFPEQDGWWWGVKFQKGDWDNKKNPTPITKKNPTTTTKQNNKTNKLTKNALTLKNSGLRGTTLQMFFLSI